MILMVLLSVALGGVLVWALYAEPAPPRPRPATTPVGTWSTGADLRRHRFPIVVAGYDPETVDAHLARIAAVHDELRRQGADQASGADAEIDLTDVTAAEPRTPPSDELPPPRAGELPPVPDDPPSSDG